MTVEKWIQEKVFCSNRLFYYCQYPSKYMFKADYAMLSFNFEYFQENIQHSQVF